MKKKIVAILAVFLTIFALSGCKGKGTTIGSADQEETIDRDAAYALGLSMGMRLKEGMIIDGIYPNLDQFLKGMKDGMSEGKTRYDIYEANEIIETAIDNLQEQRFEDVIKEGNAFLAENSKNPNVKVTASGLQYEVLIEGNGPKPSEFDTVEVHYDGRLLDGYSFDNSYESAVPVKFMVGGVIPGWSEGIRLMSVGSKYKFYIPYNLGYGSRGVPNQNPMMGGFVIPPFATLIFTVELLGIEE
jgi:FKBP-type peptidyl-prolyl cis-trans isomerase FklB